MLLCWALNPLSNNTVPLDDITLASSSTIRNLGVLFDQKLSFNAHKKTDFKDSLLSPL